MQQQHDTGNKVFRYQEIRREEKKIHKKRKREWEKKQLEELQDLYCTREARKLYSKVKETKKEFKPRVNICKAKDGSIICDQNRTKYWHDGMSISTTSLTKIIARNIPLWKVKMY